MIMGGLKTSGAGLVLLHNIHTHTPNMYTYVRRCLPKVFLHLEVLATVDQHKLQSVQLDKMKYFKVPLVLSPQGRGLRQQNFRHR